MCKWRKMQKSDVFCNVCLKPDYWGGRVTPVNTASQPRQPQFGGEPSYTMIGTPQTLHITEAWLH